MALSRCLELVEILVIFECGVEGESGACSLREWASEPANPGASSDLARQPMSRWESLRDSSMGTTTEGNAAEAKELMFESGPVL
jgi:hypothetical protein